jgi:hypothetical protein
MNVYQEFFKQMDSEEWEFFAIDFLAFQGFSILQLPSRGADGGLDGLVEYNNIKYLVSCKHYIQSNKSVGTNDENNIMDRLVHHKATGFIGFYSTLPSTSLVTRFNSYREQNYEIVYFDKDSISDTLPNLPSDILQKYGLPNNIQYVMNVHSSQYQPLECIECGIDILDDNQINISRVQVSINDNSELEFFYGCKTCLSWEEIGWLEIIEALHQDRFLSWNRSIDNELKVYKPAINFYKNKNEFDSKIQQRMFPSNWGKHSLSLIEW